MARWRSFNATAICLGLVWLPGLADNTPGPLEVIRTSNARVLEIFASAEENDRTARAEIFKIIESVSDLDRIAHAATERHHGDLGPEQTARLLGVFKRLLKASSISKLGRYRADRFEYLGEEISGDSAVVHTKAHSGGEFMSIDYIMQKVEGRWLIINYIADDVDTIRNYRKQFLKLFKEHGFEEVIARLEKKVQAFEEGSREDPLRA